MKVRFVEDYSIEVFDWLGTKEFVQVDIKKGTEITEANNLMHDKDGDVITYDFIYNDYHVFAPDDVVEVYEGSIEEDLRLEQKKREDEMRNAPTNVGF